MYSAVTMGSVELNDSITKPTNIGRMIMPAVMRMMKKYQRAQFPVQYPVVNAAASITMYQFA